MPASDWCTIYYNWVVIVCNWCTLCYNCMVINCDWCTLYYNCVVIVCDWCTLCYNCVVIVIDAHSITTAWWLFVIDAHSITTAWWLFVIDAHSVTTAWWLFVIDAHPLTTAWWLFVIDAHPLTTAWWLFVVDAHPLTTAWWLFVIDAHPLTTAWWLFVIDAHSITTAWWFFVIDARSVTTAWWLFVIDACSVTTAWWLFVIGARSVTTAWWLFVIGAHSVTTAWWLFYPAHHCRWLMDFPMLQIMLLCSWHKMFKSESVHYTWWSYHWVVYFIQCYLIIIDCCTELVDLTWAWCFVQVELNIGVLAYDDVCSCWNDLHVGRTSKDENAFINKFISRLPAGHISGELRSGRLGYYLLRWSQPTSSRGLCSHRKGTVFQGLGFGKCSSSVCVTSALNDLIQGWLPQVHFGTALQFSNQWKKQTLCLGLQNCEQSSSSKAICQLECCIQQVMLLLLRAQGLSLTGWGQLPCWPTGTSSGNCQEMEALMVRVCHAPWQPFQNHPSGHFGGLATPW